MLNFNKKKGGRNFAFLFIFNDDKSFKTTTKKNLECLQEKL